jgi:LysR family nitrogen assimilation transcriptional regulator
MATQMATAPRSGSQRRVRQTKTQPVVPSRAFGSLIDSLDLKQIRCFVAAYEEGSFSKAALRAHCTQPGLSVYIQRLEAMLAHRLFERKARGVIPTIAGRHFYACCADVLKTVSVAKQRMLDMAGNVATDINVGVSPTLFKGVLPWMLPDYLNAHPYVDVRLAEAYSGTLTEWVVSGEVQVAVVTKPPIHFGLETTHFFRDRLVLVTRGTGTRHKGRRPRRRSASELQELKLILPSPRHSLRQVIEAAAVRLGAKGSGRILEIDGMLGTLELVRNSDWATVVASIAVTDEVKQGRLIAEPIYGPELWLDFYLIRTKDQPLSPACQDFLHWLKETVARVAKAQGPTCQATVA